MKERNKAHHPWQHLNGPGVSLLMADRPVGWRAAKTSGEARAMIDGVQVTNRRTTPWKADEIPHPELTRIRAEHIRRYALADKVEASARDGFVYVMAHTIYSPGVVKVGHSRDPYRRASQANTNSAEGKHEIKYIRFFKDRTLAESLVHTILWDQRTQGEHFRVSVGEAIRVIANMEE